MLQAERIELTTLSAPWETRFPMAEVAFGRPRRDTVFFLATRPAGRAAPAGFLFAPDGADTEERALRRLFCLMDTSVVTLLQPPGRFKSR
ncbi:hypothetical protein EBZ37_01595 [bacterium]|nr:hypothetical protein [bacterium]